MRQWRSILREAIRVSAHALAATYGAFEIGLAIGCLVMRRGRGG